MRHQFYDETALSLVVKFAIVIVVMVIVSYAVAKPAHSQDYRTYGVGVAQCSQAEQADNLGLLSTWAGGYVTGINTASALLSEKTVDFTRGTDIEVLVGYIKAFCRKNPDAKIEQAAFNMLLSARKSAAEPAATQKRDEYVDLKTWDSYLASSGRYITRTLQSGSTIGNYRLIAKDHDASGNSNGSMSVCNFNANGWSDCVNNEGAHYQLKPQSIKWFMSIAGGAAP